MKPVRSANTKSIKFNVGIEQPVNRIKIRDIKIFQPQFFPLLRIAHSNQFGFWITNNHFCLSFSNMPAADYCKFYFPVLYHLQITNLYEYTNYEFLLVN